MEIIIESLIALIALSAMEIVLGIDNLVFISILTSRLPIDQQSAARRLGLAAALIMRILLLSMIFWMSRMTEPLFMLSDYIPVNSLQRYFEMPVDHDQDEGPGQEPGQASPTGESLHESPSATNHQPDPPSAASSPSSGHAAGHVPAKRIVKRVLNKHAWREFLEVSWRDLILMVGGLFLLYKSGREIHAEVEGHHDSAGAVARSPSFYGVLGQIAVMDIIFSIDSVITAVGMAEQLWVMVAAVIVAVAVMILFANQVGNFVTKNPTIKMLALNFLLIIGIMLIAEGIGTPISKGYIYFAMAFSLIVEFLNLRVRKVQSLSPTHS